MKNDRRYSVNANSLEMGVYLQQDTFVSENKYTEPILFIIDYQRRNITIEFDGHKFRLGIDFKDIQGEFHIEQQGSYWSITIANKFPARYWTSYKESWKRVVRINNLYLKKTYEPLQPRMSDNSEQLGKWVVFRITFDLDEITDQFLSMIEKIYEYNLASKSENINTTKPLRIRDGNSLIKYAGRSMLNFDVQYMIECNISFNYLHDYNLGKDFFTLLSKQPVQFAMHILEKIYEGKNRIYDPLSYLRSEIEKLNNVVIKPRYVPSYCVMMRKVVITPTTMYVLAPTMETSNRVIRNFSYKKDNFLRVQFVDEASKKIGSTNGNRNDKYNEALYNKISDTLYNGIKIGDVLYEFLAFSSSQLREHSCWFFASTRYLTANSIRKWMGDFSDIKSVPKYASRMGQCFSSTRSIEYLTGNDIQLIPDIVRNGYTFSDGIGRISNLLARKIARKLELKNIPSAFQFRMAGYKGVLCQSPSLLQNKVQVRLSQKKFNSDHNELEIIKCSTFIPAYLNRQAITLLSVLGIPDKVFIEMKDKQVNDLNKIFENENTAINILQQNVDEYEISRSLVDLVKAGFLRKKDRYLVNLISLFRIMMLKDLKRKAKIRIEKGAFLMGVLDETNTLKENEVYCRVSDSSGQGVITGECIVFRNPCFHPGDVRIVKAVNCKALSHLVDVLVFPAVGNRDIPSQCSGGDLDGDYFTLIYDKRLIPGKAKKPMDYKSQNSGGFDHGIAMKHIISFFVNYIFSDQLGKIANAHLAKADSLETGASHEQCIKLAKLHSDAVDFPKTGVPAKFPQTLRVSKFPDFMEKSDKPTYASEKVLGVLYRSIEVVEFEPYNDLNFDERLYVEGYEKYLDDARILKCEYDSNIRGLMNQFGIMTEFEITSGYIVNTVTKVDKKKPQDIIKSVMNAFIPIKRRYRKLFEEEFYEKGANAISKEADDQLKSKAYAWYYVTYHHSEFGDKDMISFPWILHDILCDIAIKNNGRICRKNEQEDDINHDIEKLKLLIGR